MDNKKLIILIRYLCVGLLIFGVSAVKRDNVDARLVSIIMLFVINNQFRFFFFDKKQTIVFSSILLEGLLGFYCFQNYGGILLFYFITGIIDGVFLLEGRKLYLAVSIIFCLSLSLSKTLSQNEGILNISATIIIGILAIYIKKEYSEKIKAQNLYDRLRISEEKLKNANRELEVYANSIEELTLLKERNRISREIHDSVGHSLSTIIIQLRAISKMAEKGSSNGQASNCELIEETATNLREFAKNSLNEVRMAVRELKPDQYEKYEGLISIEELIRNFKKLTGIEVIFGIWGEKWVLDSKQLLAMHRVIQEFLSNSLRHGKAEKINIFMNFNKNSLVLTMKDNGVGAESINKGIGLTSITERVNELKGQVEYSSKKGEGFFMKVIIKNEAKNQF